VLHHKLRFVTSEIQQEFYFAWTISSNIPQQNRSCCS